MRSQPERKFIAAGGHSWFKMATFWTKMAPFWTTLAHLWHILAPFGRKNVTQKP